VNTIQIQAQPFHPKAPPEAQEVHAQVDHLSVVEVVQA
jgi:hypothetical protein